MLEVCDLLTTKARLWRRRRESRVKRAAAWDWGRNHASINTGPGDLPCDIRMAIKVVVVVRVIDNRCTGWIKRDLEIVEQIPICRSQCSSRGDVARMDEVVARSNLPEGRIIRSSIEALSEENFPVGVIIVGCFRRAIPGDSDRSRRRPSFHPRKHTRFCFRAVAHAYT